MVLSEIWGWTFTYEVVGEISEHGTSVLGKADITQHNIENGRKSSII